MQVIKQKALWRYYWFKDASTLTPGQVRQQAVLTIILPLQLKQDKLSYRLQTDFR